MAEGSPAAAPEQPPAGEERARTMWFRAVLLGLVLLVVGFTALLIGNSFYPCEPAAGSAAQPPLADCVVGLSPWIGLVAVGVVIAGVGYLRVR